MPETICLDASVVAKLFLPEPGSEDAERLFQRALDTGIVLVAPTLLVVEVMSVLRKQARRGHLTLEQAGAAARSLLDLPIEEVAGREIHERAWRLAGDLDLPVGYDAMYLAVAEARGAVLWTADRLLFDKAMQTGYVRFLGRDPLGMS